MEKVNGFGGFFFRANNPSALGDWYRDHLGIDCVPTDYETPPWQQQAGPTVFAPFERDTDYFGNPAQSFMLNFRVRDLDAMISQLTKAGIAVELGEDFPNGRFATLQDPEGNPIELWEPRDPAAG